MEDILEPCCPERPEVYTGKYTTAQFVQRTGSLGPEGHMEEITRLSKDKAPTPTIEGTTDVIAPRKVVVGKSPVNGNPNLDAWFVDGYKHRNAFIFTREPTRANAGDFWRMVWQEKVSLVVSLEVVGQSCYSYMPTSKDKMKTFDQFKITHLPVYENAHFSTTKIFIKNVLVPPNTSESYRYIYHCIYNKWPIDTSSRIPKLGTLVAYINKLQRQYLDTIKGWKGCTSGPPILMHSVTPEISSVYMTVDISAKQLLISRKIDILNNIKQIRLQIPDAVQVFPHYEKMVLVVIDLMVFCGRVKPADLESHFAPTGGKWTEKENVYERVEDIINNVTGNVNTKRISSNYVLGKP